MENEVKGNENPEGTENNNPQEGEGTEPKGEDGKKEAQKQPKYTDDDLDRIVARITAKERSKAEQKVKEETDKLTEAQKLANMNELQKATYEKEKAEARIAELEAEKNLQDQMGVARAELAGANINLPDELLTIFVSPKADETSAAIAKIKELFPKAVDKAVQEALKRQAPPADSSQGGEKSFGATFAEQYSKKMNGGK